MRARFLFIPLILLVLVAAGLFAFVAANIDHYRPRIEAELQKKLNRPVSVGHLGLRLFPLSIRADSVTVGEDPAFASSRSFATATEVFVSAGFLSVLRGNPDVEGLTLDRPQIELIRNNSGNWNFSTLGGPAKASANDTAAQNELKLDEFQIKDGQVAITDATAGEPRLVYDHIDLKLTNFAPRQQFGIDAAVHLPGQGKQLLAFKGKGGPRVPGQPSALPLNGHLSLQEVSLSAANRFAKGSIPPGTDTMASGDADVVSENQVLSAKGNLNLKDTTVRGAKLDYPIAARFDVTDDLLQQKVLVRSGSVSLGSTSFNLSGGLDLKPKPAAINLHLETNNTSIEELAKLAGAFGVAFNPSYQVKGTITANLTATGAASAPQMNGTVTARSLDMSGGEIKQPVSVPEVTVTLSPGVMRSNTFTARCGSTALTLTGALAQYASQNSSIDATVQTNGANITELLNIAKAYGLRAAEGVSGTGTLSLNVHVQGPTADTSKLVYSGTGAISNATLTTPSLPNPLKIASANAQFARNSISITNLTASLGASTVRGTLSAENFAAPNVQFALSADTIDTADLEALSAKQTPSKSGNAPGILNQMIGSGTLAAGTLKSQDVVLTNVHANCNLNHGLITLSPLSANAFAGKADGTVAVDMRPAKPLCAVKAKLSGVDANAMLSAMTSVKNALDGSLNANSDLHFTLGSSTELTQTLNGSLGFNVVNGHLRNVNILSELSRIGKFVNGAPGQSSGSGTALKTLSATMNITNGVASTNNLTAVMDAGSLSGNGTLNLVSQAIDMHVTAVIASSVSQAVGGTGVGGFLNTALANNKGELVLPVLVTGVIGHPTFSPDVQALAKMKVNSLLPTSADPSKLTSGALNKKGVSGVLGGILGSGGTAQPSQKSQENTVNSLLNQFGKKKPSTQKATNQ